MQKYIFQKLKQKQADSLLALQIYNRQKNKG